MLYENELCHGCEKVFSAGDDIVVCPVCATPQHRACWQAHNACVSEALHAQGFLWKGGQSPAGDFDPAKELGVICPVCGTNNPAGTVKCGVCENNQTAAAAQERTPAQPAITAELNDLPFLAGVPLDDAIGGVKAYDIALYIQLSAKRYIDKFRKMDLRSTKLSWNWAAFFFSPYWFFYRKLYWLGGIFLGLTLAMAIFFSAPMLEFARAYEALLPVLTKSDFAPADMMYAAEKLAGFSWVIYGFTGLTLLTHSVSALLANMAYKKKVAADVASIRRFAKDEKVFQMLTVKRGGTSSFALLGSVLGYNLLLEFVNYLVKQF